MNRYNFCKDIYICEHASVRVHVGVGVGGRSNILLYIFIIIYILYYIYATYIGCYKKQPQRLLYLYYKTQIGAGILYTGILYTDKSYTDIL